MNPYKIIEKYLGDNKKLHDLYLKHVEHVKEKALEIAQSLKEKNPNLDLKFIEEACILHDIGIFKTDAPSLYCYGHEPYLAHGYLGREILESEGLPKHALVCERHTGSGLSKEEIRNKSLPLPNRDLMPITLEEKIICFADNFYSKDPDKLDEEISFDEIKNKQKKHGEQEEAKLVSLAKELGYFSGI